MLPHAMLCPGTELIFSIQISLLPSLLYVVLANRNFQYTSLNSTVASLTLFPVVEDRLVLVLFQRNSVGNVLKKKWPFMVVSLGAPQRLCERKGIKMTACFSLASLLSHFLGKQTITAD